MSEETGGRYCPECGLATDELLCPLDQVATIDRKSLQLDSIRLNAGDVVADRYRVTEIIGRGGFGAVYAAEHVATKQEVALKLLLPSGGEANEEDVRRFYREAQVTAGLRHPNTVRVFDLGQTSGGGILSKTNNMV